MGIDLLGIVAQYPTTWITMDILVFFCPNLFVLFSSHSNERLFLRDFVACSAGTSGGRLARWLQPDSFVDPSKCEVLYSKEEMRCGWPAIVTIITRDQYGDVVHVPDLKVNPIAPSRMIFNSRLNMNEWNSLLAIVFSKRKYTQTHEIGLRLIKYASRGCITCEGWYTWILKLRWGSRRYNTDKIIKIQSYNTHIKHFSLWKTYKKKKTKKRDNCLCI